MAYVSAAAQGSAERISARHLDDGRIILDFGPYACAILTKAEAKDACAAIAAAIYTLSADEAEANEAIHDGRYGS